MRVPMRMLMPDVIGRGRIWRGRYRRGILPSGLHDLRIDRRRLHRCCLARLLCRDLLRGRRRSDVLLLRLPIGRVDCRVGVGRSGLVRNRGVGELLHDFRMVVRRDELAGVRLGLDRVVEVPPDRLHRLVRRVVRIKFLTRLVSGLRPKSRISFLVQDIPTDRRGHGISK